jgi:hypothetical protein
MGMVPRTGVLVTWLGISGLLGCGSSSPAGSGGGGTNGGGGSGGGVPGNWLPTATTNDDATLSGASLGPCATPTLLRKKIPVTLTGGGTEFSLGDAYLMSVAADLAYAYLAIPVTNLGTTMHCFVSTTNYSWLDSQGNSEGDFLTYVTGTVGQVDPTIYTDSCLEPGETGFLFDIQSNLTTNDIYTPTTSITFALGTSSGGALPPPKILPQSYSLAAGALTVTFANSGTGPGELTEACPFVLVDSGGLPTLWGFFELTTPGELDVGQQGTGTDATPEGCGQELRAYIPFGSPNVASGPTAPNSAAASALAWRSLLVQKVAAARARR